jgi:hypothetical chaperone protein
LSSDSVAVGFDFGTTNSSIAVAKKGEPTRLARFSYSGGSTESFRSLLYLERHKDGARHAIKSWSGPVGIDHYLAADDKGRLIQSLKSFLASRTLHSTEIFGRRFQLEDLTANIMRDIRKEAEARLGLPIQTATVGRPVRFVGSESDADDQYAQDRLRDSLARAGFGDVRFELEPVAAAHYYAQTVNRPELVMIGDFGGGTSDFSLLSVSPGAVQVVANEGLSLAGDAFDAKIVRHLVSPALGAGTSLNSNGKLLPVPGWVYHKLERWHHLSFLRSKDTLNMLESVSRQALEPDKIQALLYLVRQDLGYQLHRAVQRVKVTLSHAERTVFRFSDGDTELEEEVTREQFEDWISEELSDIDQRVESLLAKAGTDPAQVDRIFLTGGTSLVPAVRRVFASRFGDNKLRTGDEFTSVAHGLAVRGLS